MPNIPLFTARGLRTRIIGAGASPLQGQFRNPITGGALGGVKDTTASGYYPSPHFVGKRRRGIFVGTQEEASAYNQQLRRAQNIELRNKPWMGRR